MQIIKDGNVLNVTKKAFEIIYQSHGYTEYIEEPKSTRKAKTKAGD